MHDCPTCRRPLIHAESACPFCSAAQPTPGRAARSIGRGFMAVLTPLVLAACYGTPGGADTMKFDNDGDGYGVDEDCDDDNIEVNPGATETCDDEIDNDCDGLVDADDVDTCV